MLVGYRSAVDTEAAPSRPLDKYPLHISLEISRVGAGGRVPVTEKGAPDP